jgi:hypothetical protein
MSMKHSTALGTVLAILLAAGCGNPVTDPLDQGYDPRPVLGTWHLVGRDGCPDPGHVAVVERGVGTLYGHFSFPLWGQEWQVFFADVPWDGTRFVFSESETYGLRDPMVWRGVFTAGRQYADVRVPDQLTMEGIRSISYVRPGDAMPSCPAG